MNNRDELASELAQIKRKYMETEGEATLFWELVCAVGHHVCQGFGDFGEWLDVAAELKQQPGGYRSVRQGAEGGTEK